MSNKRSTLGTALAYGLAAVICIGAGVGVGRMIPFGKSQAAVQNVVAAASHQRMVPNQGVTVHGWWTIQVRQDGRVVKEKEFENALVTSGTQSGDAALTSLLGGRVPGYWIVDALQNTPCTTSGCNVLFRLISSDPALAGFEPLTVNTNNDSNGNVGHHLTLSGSYTANSTITIASVQTFVRTCDSNYSADDCKAGTGSQTPGLVDIFTSANLNTAVTVQANQQVSISVDFTFTAA